MAIRPPANWGVLESQSDTVQAYRVRLFPQGVANSDFDSANAIEFLNDNLSLSGIQLEGAICNDLSVGNVCSAVLKAAIVGAPSALSAMCPPDTLVDFSIRLEGGGSYSGTVTDWVRQGVFRVESLDSIDGGDIFNLIAYDDVYHLEGVYYPETETDVTLDSFWSFVESNTVASIAQATKSEISSSYASPIPAAVISGASVRKVLEVLAAMAGGNLYISKQNVLTFKHLTTNFATTNASGYSVFSYKSKTDFLPLFGAIINAENNAKMSGHVNLLKVSLPDAYAEKNNIAAAVTNRVFNIIINSGGRRNPIYYGDFSFDAPNVSPLFELGDVFTANGFRVTVASYRLTFSGRCSGLLESRRSDGACYLRESESGSSDWFDIATYADTKTGTVELLGETGWAIFTFPLITLDGSGSRSNVAYLSTEGALNVTVSYTDSSGTTRTKTVSASVFDQGRYYEAAMKSPTSTPPNPISSYAVLNFKLFGKDSIFEDTGNTFNSVSITTTASSPKFYITD